MKISWIISDSEAVMLLMRTTKGDIKWTDPDHFTSLVFVLSTQVSAFITDRGYFAGNHLCCINFVNVIGSKQPDYRC